MQEKDNYNKKGKKWNEEEEKKLIDLLENGSTLEECTQIHQRTLGAIKSRIDYIIYKMIKIENKSIDELNYLKKHTNTNVDEIIKKYENKSIKKDKLNINKNDFEENILKELKEIKDILKQIVNK